MLPVILPSSDEEGSAEEPRSGVVGCSAVSPSPTLALPASALAQSPSVLNDASSGAVATCPVGLTSTRGLFSA
jgi:hypothetical protein